jgi:alpha-aminoadipate/glutamate carrier protein LysW
MSVEFIKCPACGQKLALQDYVLKGNEVVCANQKCLTTLHIDQRNPLRLSVVPVEQTRNVDSRPESYG